MICVGGVTPDSRTGRVTMTSVIADEDNYIPGLAKLEVLH